MRIKGEEIPVYYDPLLEKRNMMGYAFRNPHRIDLSPVEKPLLRLSTLLHEMLHHTHWGLSEKTVLALETRLLEMVLNNPAVFRKLLRHAARP